MSERLATVSTCAVIGALTLALGAPAQVDSVLLKTDAGGAPTPRLVVTTSTAGQHARVRVENGLFRLSGSATVGSSVVGELRYSGSDLQFHDGAAWRKMTQVGPAAAQTDASGNALLHLDETGAGSPSLLELEVGGTDRFVVANDGAVTAGIWKGATVTVDKGGTGLSTLGAAGRLLYSTGPTSLTSLPVGASGTYLRSNGASPAWSSILASDLPTGSGSYIQNQTAAAQAASFYISGYSRIIGSRSGALFESRNADAGASTNYGVYGEAIGASTGWNIGVEGVANNSSSNNWGVQGRSQSNGGYGVRGWFSGAGWGTGVGATNSATGTAGSQYALYAQVNGNLGALQTKYGARVESIGTAATNYGTYSTASGATTNYGLFATAAGGTTNWAGYFQGDVNITGQLTIGGDPPLIVSGTTRITNLNADMVDGVHYSSDWNNWIDGGTYLYPSGGISTNLRIADVQTETYGVYCRMTGQYGAWLESIRTGSFNYGVYAQADADYDYQYGVYARAQINSTANYYAYGVYGLADANDSAGTAADAWGGYFLGYGDDRSYGVYAYAWGGASTAYGIYASAGGAPTSWAGYFAGNVYMSGEVDRPAMDVSFFAVNTASDNVGSGWLKVEFNSENHDDGNDYNNTLDRFICPADGVYSFETAVTFTGLTDGTRYGLAFYKNGSRVATVGLSEFYQTNEYSTHSGSLTIKLVAGDYIEVYGYSTDTTTTHYSAGGTFGYCYFSGHRVY